MQRFKKIEWAIKVPAIYKEQPPVQREIKQRTGQAGSNPAYPTHDSSLPRVAHLLRGGEDE